MNPGNTHWRWFYIVAALEAGAAVLALARIPSEGLSAARLAMLAFLGLCLAGALYLAARPQTQISLASRVHPSVPAAFTLVIGVSLFLLRYADPPRLLPIYARLSPLLFFLLLFSLQSAGFLFALRRGFHPRLLSDQLPSLRPWLFFFLALLAVLLLVSLTRLGITPDPAYWGEPGVPLQGWQFVLALLLGLLALLLASILDRSARFLLPILIYIIALAVWLSVPSDVLKNGFYVSVHPPSQQPFPYSDSAYYDSMAQSLFIGQPYRGEIPTRPLYIVLLALLHLLFGQRYDLILVAQTVVLAVIPVLFYWLGTRLHSRAAGVTVALFFIFREWTSLLITSETRTSNTRMLLVDLPTLMLVLLACLLAFRWLERRDNRSALAAGGAFGLLLMLRTQSLLILPILLLAALLIFWRQWKTLAVHIAIFILGLALAVSPWLLHNYILTGQVTFDAAFQYKVIASQYAYTGNLDIANFDFEGKGVGQILLQFLMEDPGFVLGFIANHFLAGWVGGLLALPLIVHFNGLLAPLNLYWTQWDGHLAWYNVLLIILYLALIALGLAASWRRWRWAGLLPLVFNIGYSLATAVGRFSGWRYDLPADWVPYFYLSLGFVELIHLLGSLFDFQPRDGVPEEYARNRSLRSLLPLGMTFVALGALPWIAALLAAPQFTDQSPDVLIPRLAQVSGAPSQEQVLAFLESPNAVLTEGRLLYPRYFYKGAGLSSASASPAFAPRDFPRQGFLLLNQNLTQALFPTRDPLDFPQAEDVILLGCQREDYLEARLVAFPAVNTSFLSASLSEPCP